MNVNRKRNEVSCVITEQINLETEECCTCAVVFAMPASLKLERRNNGGSFYCPNGHSQHYTKTRVKQLEEQLAQIQYDLRAAKCNLLDAQNREVKLGRKLKRVANGVCPCCKRSFTNLRQHMKTQHPEQAK